MTNTRFTDETFEESLYTLTLFLGDGYAPLLQARLLGQTDPLTRKECEEVRSICINAVLTQVEYLEKPYRDGIFETDGGRVRWLSRQPIHNMRVTLHPMDTTPPRVRYYGIDMVER